jgi:prepilin-type N-terminal cleavage/methylation domain-containing protein
MSLPDQSHVRRGFTLTELLVVIAIIAILAALASVGIMTAMNKARATAIKTELDQLDAAMKRYKDTYGSYPPCNLAFLDTTTADANERTRRLAVLKQHLAMAFPRYNAAVVESNNKTKLENDLTWAGIDLYHVRPDQALVFWLQGFSSDPTNPILSINGKQIVNSAEIGTPQKRTNNFFEFDPTRLAGRTIDANTLPNPSPSYFPTNARISTTTISGRNYPAWESGTPPIVYFDSRFYEYAAPVLGGAPAQANQFNIAGAGTLIFDNAGVAAPYWHDRNKNTATNMNEDFSSQEGWANPESFQLIASGADGKYGLDAPPTARAARLYPTGLNYDITTLSDDDNATNFTSSARLGDDLP